MSPLTTEVLLKAVLQRAEGPGRELVHRLVRLDEVSERRAQSRQLLRGIFSAQVVEALPGGIDTALLVLQIFLKVLPNVF